MGGGLVFPNVENSILENNLFGVDINNESVEIAKLSLWLRTAQPNRKLNDLSNNIKCGNSLIDDPEVAGQKAFSWENEFPQVFAKGGFDVVIGNPPYFNIQTLGVGSEVAQSIQRDYSEIWQDKSDILFYFFYKAMQISKSEIGYIVSNAFLFSDKAQRLRNYILKDDRLSKIINFDKYMVFSDASITSCITTFSKNKVETKAIVLKDKQYTISEISDQINNPQLEFKIELETDKVFALVDSKIASLNKKIDSDHEKLQNIFHVGKGMETADNQFPEEYIKKRMVGEKIDRYFLSPIDSYLLYFEDVDDFEDLPNTVQDYLLENKPKLKNRADKKRRATSKWWNYSFPMHKEFYHLDKIWCSYRSKRNEFIIDQSQDFIGLTNTTVLFDTNKNYSLKYVLTLLNSKLLNFRYKSIGKQTGGGVYEYFANGIGKFPIPEISIKKQQPFIEKADEILALNQELDELSSKFERNLQRQFPEELEKLPKKLQDWYELSYANFIKELKKKKIKLSLSQEAEWEDYFLSEQQKATSLTTQINQTDKEIDQMVYELYGLTDEEIAIVENS
jgi:hypothetical protein